MKKGLRALLTMSLMAGLSFDTSYPSNEQSKKKIKTWDDLTDTEKQYYIKKWNEIQEQIALNKGLKKFVYGEFHVFALNQKNADKKAKKLGLI